MRKKTDLPFKKYILRVKDNKKQVARQEGGNG